MNRPVAITLSPGTKPAAGSTQILYWVCLVGFLCSFVPVFLQTLRIPVLDAGSGWATAFLVLTAAVTTMVSLAKQLPAQNVVLAAAIIGIVAGTVEAVGAISGIPFGPFFYAKTSGPRIFNTLPWCVPLVWIAALLGARGVARLILRPWRKSRLYGFRLIGVTAALTLVFDLGIEPFATRVNHYWVWEPTKFAAIWPGTPPTNFLGWLVTSLLILAFVTPVMINKSHKKFPSDLQPLIVWTLLNVLFVTAAVVHQLWASVILIALTSVITIVMAIRGARW